MCTGLCGERRITIQAALVLETVNKLQSHATADEGYQEIVREHPYISRGTVYRNLNRLAQAGEIRKIELSGGADRFDHLCHDHCHVRCEKCGWVFDVDIEFISGLEKTSEVPTGSSLPDTILFLGGSALCAEHDQVIQAVPNGL